MPSNHFVKRIALAAIAILAVTPSHATLVEFFGEDLSPSFMVPAGGYAQKAREKFLLNLTTGVGTEDFEGFNEFDGDGAPLGITFQGSGKTAEITGAGFVGVTQVQPFGRFNTTGTVDAEDAVDGKWWDVSGIFTIDFSSSPISAFGFYGTDIGDFGGQVTVALTYVDGSETKVKTLTINNTHEVDANNGSLLFWGFYDTEFAYTKITFGNTNEQDGSDAEYFGFDDMVVGGRDQVRPIPEPATLLLTGLGLLGLAASRRKQRH